ncbi:MAG: hypothetical protein C0524_13970 [Rhodobacter sp.]|nr:hypothetical protein [Rhodobacter sp.]
MRAAAGLGQTRAAQGAAGRMGGAGPRHHAGRALRGARRGGSGAGEPGRALPGAASHGIHVQKKSLVAAERRRADVVRARHDRTSRRQPLMRESPERLVFIDETSVKTNMTRPRGRARKGRRLHAHAPAGLWNTQTFIAGRTGDSLIAPWVIKGAMDREAFDTYIETHVWLAPAWQGLCEGSVELVGCGHVFGVSVQRVRCAP